MPVETVKVYKTQDGWPFQGDTNLIPRVKRFMVGDGYGHVVSIHELPPKGDITCLHKTWYDGGDKNCFNLWGLDASNKVICGIGSIQEKGTWKVEICKMDAANDFPGG